MGVQAGIHTIKNEPLKIGSLGRLFRPVAPIDDLPLV